MSIRYAVYIDWDANGNYTGTYDDVTADVKAVDVLQGLTDPLRHVAAVGTCTLELDNSARRYSAANSAGPLYGKLLPNRPVRVDVTDGASTWTVFEGVTRRLSADARANGPQKATIQCEDAIGVLQAHAFSLPIQESKRGDELLRLICASAFGGAAATGTVRFTGQPAVGNSVSVGGRTYTFVNTLTGANQVKIGATITATADNLAAAINGDAGAGTRYGTGTVRHPLVTATGGAGITDTQQQTNFTGSYKQIGDIGGADYMIAQQFVPGVTGRPTLVTLYMAAELGSPTGDITLAIYSDDGADTPNASLYSTTFTPTTGTNTIPIATSTVLTAGTKYWLVCSIEPQASNNAWLWGAGAGSAYPYIAKYSIDAGTSWSSSTTDAVFSVTVTADGEITAVARGTWGNAITLSRVGANITVSGATLGGGTDGGRTLTFETSSITHEYAADRWGQEDTSALDAASDVIASEGTAFLWAAADGSLVYKDKLWWFTLPTTAATLAIGDEAVSLESAVDVADVQNEIVVSYRPRALKSAGVVAKATGVIEVPVTTRDPRWNTTKDLPDGGKYVLRLPYIDQATGQPTGATGLITPVAGTDFRVWESIGGRDYTALGLISVSVAPTGSGVECTFINHGGTPFYVTDFQVRGTAIIEYDVQQAIRQDATSITAYGKRARTVDLPLYSSQSFSEGLADYLLYQFKDARLRVARLDFGHITHVGSTCLYSLALGEVVTLSNTQVGLADERLVLVGRALALAPGGVSSLTLDVRYVEDLTYWVLDDTTYSRLGVTTRLSL